MAKTQTAAKAKTTILEPSQHEMVPISSHEEVAAPETPEEQGKKEIQKFNVARSWIADLKEKWLVVPKISGIDDKDGIKAVTEFWQAARNKRLAVEKKHKEIKGDYVVISRMIDGEKNDLSGLLREIEDPAGAELDRIADLKKEADLAEERAAQQKLQGRVAELLENGMAFSGSYYTIGENVAMDVVTLKGMPDAEYNSLLNRVKIVNRDILEEKRIANEKEAARLQGIEDQRKENERIAEQNRQQQEKINLQLKQLADMRKKSRAGMLSGLGMTFNYNRKEFQFVTATGHAGMTEKFVEDAEDEAFTETFASLETNIKLLKDLAFEKAEEDRIKEVNRLAAEKEKNLKDSRFNERSMELFKLFRMTKNQNRHEIISTLGGNLEGVTVFNETIYGQDDKTWANTLNELKKQYKKFVAGQEKAQALIDQQKETKRLAKMGDGELIEDMLGRICAPMVMQGAKPDLKTEAGKLIWITFDAEFTELIERTHTYIDNLK